MFEEKIGKLPMFVKWTAKNKNDAWLAKVKRKISDDKVDEALDSLRSIL